MPTKESKARPFDVIVFGATGTTGLVAAELLTLSVRQIRWAIAGRNATKLSALQTRLAGMKPEGKSEECGVVIADVGDKASLLEMARLTKVVLTTVGPYTAYGESVIEACIEAKAHYVDITGEVGWVGKMATKYNAKAKAAGVCISSFCGYDCVPTELSLVLANKAAGEGYRLTSAETLVKVDGMKSHGMPKGTVKTFYRLSGGPLSLIQTFTEGIKYVPSDERLSAIRDMILWLLPLWSSAARGFTLPNFMGLVNIPVIHKSAYIHGFGGVTFYDRMPIPSNLFTGYGLFIVLAVYALVSIAMPAFFVLNLFFSGWFKSKMNSMSPTGTKTATVKCTLEGKASPTDGVGDTKRISVTSIYPGDPGIYMTCLCANEVAMGIASASSTVPTGFHTPVTALSASVLAERLKTAGVKINVSVRSDS